MCEGMTPPHQVSAVDLLVPEVGEVVGGTLREERAEVLHSKLQRWANMAITEAVMHDQLILFSAYARTGLACWKAISGKNR